MQKFRFENYFLLRAPKYPVTDIFRIRDIHTHDLEKFCRYIISLFKDEQLREGIYYASPALYEELEKIKDPGSVPLKELRKISFSLFKYLVRSCTRATPFGIFAGCGMGTVKETTRLNFHEQTEF